MILLAVTDHSAIRTFTFLGDEVVIGSASEVDLVIDQEGVAPRHLRVRRSGDKLWVDDLLGRRRSRIVESGARLRIAGVELHVELLVLAPEGVVDDVERRMLDELRERPGDAALREVYADWLDEHGQAARAEFLRTQLAAGAVTRATDPAFAAAAARLAELAPSVGDGWRARVAMSFIEACPTLDRETVRADFLRVQLAVDGVTRPTDAELAAAAVHFAELMNDIATQARQSSPTAAASQRREVLGAMWLRARLAAMAQATDPEPEPTAGMELVCPMRWDKLVPTEREEVRVCGACQREVVYCTTIDQATIAAEAGTCIAVDLKLPRHRGDLSGPRMLGRPSPPLSRYGRRSS